MSQLVPREPGGEFLLYQTEEGQSRIEVRMQGETLWLTQAAMAELFQTSTPRRKFGKGKHSGPILFEMGVE